MVPGLAHRDLPWPRPHLLPGPRKPLHLHPHHHQIRSDRFDPLYPGAGLYGTKETNTTDEPDSILEAKTTPLLVFLSFEWRHMLVSRYAFLLSPFTQ